MLKTYLSQDIQYTVTYINEAVLGKICAFENKPSLSLGKCNVLVTFISLYKIRHHLYATVLNVLSSYVAVLNALLSIVLCRVTACIVM